LNKAKVPTSNAAAKEKAYQDAIKEEKVMAKKIKAIMNPEKETKVEFNPKLKNKIDEAMQGPLKAKTTSTPPSAGATAAAKRAVSAVPQAAPAATSAVKSAATAAAPAVAKAGTSLAGKAIPVLGAAADYAMRKSEGQSHLRAGLGAAASTLGGIGGAALGSAAGPVGTVGGAVAGGYGAGKLYDYAADKIAGPVTPPKPEATEATAAPKPAATPAATGASVNTQLNPAGSSASKKAPVTTSSKDGVTGKALAGQGIGMQDRRSQAYVDQQFGAGKMKAGSAASNLALLAKAKKDGTLSEPVAKAAGAASGNADIDTKTQAIAAGASPAQAAQANRDAGKVMGTAVTPKK
jgi:hypothetical protein